MTEIDQIHKVKNKNNEEYHLWHSFLRAFTLMITNFFPIMMVCFFILIKKQYTNDANKSYSVEAIGYTINFMFVTIYYSVLFICNMTSKIKKKIIETEDYIERKKLIDSAFAMIMTIVLILLAIFCVLSIIYSQVRATKMGEHHIVSNYIIHWMLMMIPIIIFNTVAMFFANLTFSLKGFNRWYIISSLFLFAIIETLFIYAFSFIKTNNIIVFLLIPTLIISGIKMIVYAIVFYSKIQYIYSTKMYYQAKQKLHFFLVSKEIYVELFKKCSVTIYFGISYTLSIIVQSILIKFSYVIDNHLEYYFTNDGFYILLFIKIIVYNLIYLIYIFSRSFNIAIIDHENHENKDLKEKIKRREYLRRINYSIQTTLLLVCFLLFFSLKSLTNSLFGSLDWYQNETVTSDQMFKGMEFKVLVPKLVQEGFIYGTISFFFVDHSIVNRNIISKTDQSNKLTTWLVISSYFVCLSSLSYVFPFLFNKIFPGLGGFFISFGIYGIVALFFVFILDWKRRYTIYKEYFPKQMENISLIKFSCYRVVIDKEYKTNFKRDLIIYSISSTIIVAILSAFVYFITAI